MISQSPTFCPCPWTSLNIDQTGRVLPCLNSHVLNFKLGNVHQQTIQQVITGTELQNLKKTIAAGHWHVLCTNCRVNEEQTGASARTQMTVNQEVKDEIDKNIDYFKLTDLTVNWSNLCNLTCTYCNPSASTAWQNTLHIPIKLEKNEHQDLIQLARDNKHTLKGLTLGGGEPLLQKTLPDFLKELDPNTTRVMITTNLGVDLSKNPVYQELKTWPQVTWQVSFDNACADKFEYVRNGCDWNLFVNNLDVLKSDGITPTAHPAYSIYCAFDLVEYYEFCEQNNLDVFWCELSHPYELDVKCLPQYLRKLAQQEIDQVLQRWGHCENFSLETLKQYRSRLDFEHTPAKMTPAEFHATQEKILKQKHSFSQLWPGLVF